MANGQDPDPLSQLWQEFLADTEGLRDTIFAVTGEPKYLTPKGLTINTEGQYFPERDSMTVAQARRSWMEPILIHEAGHRLQFKGGPEVGPLVEAATQDTAAEGALGDIVGAPPSNADDPIAEAFAQNFEQAVRAIREGNQAEDPEAFLQDRMAELEEQGRPGTRDFIDFLLSRVPFAGTPLGRRHVGAAQRAGVARRDATNIGG